ncbi:MAG: helix-turn-helix domain-containing protein [Sphingomonas sp.]|jgi:transcriptional regulator with XRE-family HTH domain|uniref:helix-turn-helix domain-containing protein n=1 Tax=Sphingomonas sp. TaxID=28214 RepID=UPI0035699444
MTDENPPPPKPGSSLGSHLAAIRNDRGYSLRQVEGLTNNIISNAYLSQIESGKIQQPSPNILHALANVYRISYEQLMEMAGFIVGNREKGDVSHGRAATFAELNLSEDEERELLEYLKFRRGLKG